MTVNDIVNSLTWEEVDADEGDLTAGAIILTKVVKADGSVGLQMHMTGLNWIERLGILTQAKALEEQAPMYSCEDDD